MLVPLVYSQACGIQVPSGGEFKAVIAADTLFPEGSGQSLSQEDQDFIWEVSLALSKAYEAAEGKVCVWDGTGRGRAGQWQPAAKSEGLGICCGEQVHEAAGAKCCCSKQAYPERLISPELRNRLLTRYCVYPFGPIAQGISRKRQRQGGA